jgi:hypothetical protein
MGTLVVCTPNNARKSELVLHNVLHMPSISYTLVSLRALDEEGYTSHISRGCLQITSPCREQIADITCTRHLYRVKHSLESAHVAKLMSSMELHHHLRHISVISAHKLTQSGAVKGIKLDPNASKTDCEACIFARATCLPIYKPRVSIPAQSFGDEVHTDIWGPAPISTLKGAQYFITFTDDSTCFTVIYLLRTKDEVLKQYKFFEVWAITQQHCSGIKVLCSDHRGEYLSKAFDKHLAAVGTARQLTTHDTPQLNGIAERLNWTLLEHICALQHATGLPKMLWGEALRHATWLKNQTATHALDNKTPFEALYGTTPDLSEVQPWGCKVWVHNDNGSKLDVHAREGQWLGFNVNTQAHRVFWPNSGTISIERNVYFALAGPLEGEESPFQIISSEQTAAPDTPSTSDSPSSPISSTQSTPSSSSPEPVYLRCSMHICKPSRIIHDL